MVEAVSIEKCLPLQAFIFPAGTTLHQGRDMDTCSDQTQLGQGRGVLSQEIPSPRTVREQEQGERGQCTGREAQRQPVVLLIHP